MNPGWLLKTRSPSSFIRPNASRASSELKSTFHLPMVQRRYVTTPPGLLLCYGHHTITDLFREEHLRRWRILAKAHIRTTLFTQPPSRGEPVEKVDVGSVGGFEWSSKSPKSVFSAPYRGVENGREGVFQQPDLLPATRSIEPPLGTSPPSNRWTLCNTRWGRSLY